MSEGGAQTPGRGGGPDGEREARLRQMRARAPMVRAGVTSFALLGGISCYVLLLQFQLVSQPVALVIGLVFALLVRVAAGSLTRDWLQQQIARHEGDSTRAPGNDTRRSS
jgi:hypothetical protein